MTHDSAIIFDRGRVREAAIWGAFQFNGPFPTLHATERTILFGIYANTYLHGMNYLSEIDSISLAQMIANYDNAIAHLSNEEAQLVIEIVAKRYLETIDLQIHTENMVTGYKKIDALDDEYDVREAALDADREALITKRAEVQLAWDRAAQRIKELETRVELEAVAYQMVDVEITEQELRAAKADLELIEAGLKGLDIQLAITQTGIDITNTDLQITEAGNEVSEIGIRVSETELDESEVDLDIVNAGIGLSKSQADGTKINLDIKRVAVNVSEVQLQVADADAKGSEINAQIAGIEADTAKLALVDSELTIVQADKRISVAENLLLVSEKEMIDSQQDNIINETSFIETQTETQEILDGKILSNDQAQHDFEIKEIEAKLAFEYGVSGITGAGMLEKKLDALEAKKTLADDKKTLALDKQTTDENIREFEADIDVYKLAKAVEHAQLLADADVVNRLTHSIGQA